MKEKIPLKEVLSAIDLGARSLWSKLSQDEQNSISFFILNRMCSFTNGNREQQELAVLKTNEYYNKNFYDIGTSKKRDHRKLLWHLACMCGDNGKILYHPWVKLNTESNSTNKEKLIRKLRPDLGSQEVKVLERIATETELNELAKEHGIEPSKTK